MQELKELLLILLIFYDIVIFCRGTAVAKLVAENVEKSNKFDSTVRLYVHDEIYNGVKISEIINRDHVNQKYLPNINLPLNIVS